MICESKHPWPKYGNNDKHNRPKAVSSVRWLHPVLSSRTSRRGWERSCSSTSRGGGSGTWPGCSISQKRSTRDLINQGCMCTKKKYSAISWENLGINIKESSLRSLLHRWDRWSRPRLVVLVSLIVHINRAKALTWYTGAVALFYPDRSSPL